MNFLSIYRLFKFIPLLIIIGCTGQNLLLKDNNKSIPKISGDMQPTFSSNTRLHFLDFMKGVNSAIVLTNSEFENTFSFDEQFHRKYFRVVRNYLNGIGIENVALTFDERREVKNKIPLQYRFYFELDFDLVDDYLTQLNINIKTCNGDKFIFTNALDYYVDENWDDQLFASLKEAYWVKNDFDSTYSLKLSRVITEWNESSLKKYYLDGNTDNIEGIYEKYGITDFEKEVKYRIAVVKKGPKYEVIYLNGALKSNGWVEGELKGTIEETSLKDFFKVNWIMADKSTNKNVYLTTDKKNILDFDFLTHESSSKIKYLKVFPNFSAKLATAGNYISSGTGFLIAKEGIIVTNNHIVNNSNNVSVEFEVDSIIKKYSAEIIFNDKKNDISLLKITNRDYQPVSEIPYLIYDSQIPLGTSVYTLGFPLIETMGETIKLSDGIISSQTGYMGDKDTYQLTAPINPGNSGGPLFDINGNLVGVVNAKYTGAENVAYAIKSEVIKKILEQTGYDSSNLNLLKLNNKDFIEQVSNLTQYVCLIKVY